jgi:hypothetical protein
VTVERSRMMKVTVPLANSGGTDLANLPGS